MLDGIQMFDGLVLLAQDTGPEAAGGLAAMLIGFLCGLAMVAAMGALHFWGIFKKAGESAWLSMIPIVQGFVLCKVAGRPLWWGVLLLIPIVSLVIFVIVCIDLAKKFGKDPIWAVGLILLSFVFFPILGFGDAKYDPSA